MIKWNSKKEANGTTYSIEDEWDYCKQCPLKVPKSFLSKKGLCPTCNEANQNTLKEWL